jgi:NTP pyrophosphatase (non-canonical NTP hydrolase)
MNFDDYQLAARGTAIYPGQGGIIGAAYAALGLNGEAGETAEQIKKTWRDDGADLLNPVLDAIGRFERDLPFRAPEQIPFYFGELRDEITDIFTNPFSEDRKERIVKELGDTLWYAAQLATELGVSLEDVAQQNIDKLAARRATNTLHGDGSDRERPL